MRFVSLAFTAFTAHAALTLACTPPATSDSPAGRTASTGDDAPTHAVAVRTSAPAPTQRLAVGERHACELRGAGEVWCWGRNTDGQCGVDGETQLAAPRRVALDRSARAVVAGGRHTCAVLDSGELSCWGWGGFGQLGDGRRESSSTPVTVSELRDVVDAAAGELHTCAVDARGRVWCWGSDTLGQLGRGVPERPASAGGSGAGDAAPESEQTGGQRRVAAPRTELLGPLEPDSSPAPTGGLAIRTGPPSGSPAPRLVPVEHARRIATQEHWTCAIVEEGAVTCWGRDPFDHVRPPAIVEGVSQAVAVTAGRRVACALRVDGVVSCWGRGEMGQLGDGTHESRADARPVVELDDVVEIGAGDERACARLADGRVRCWGSGGLGDYYGRTGAPTPYDAHGITGAVSLGVGPADACATVADGSTWCWGESTRLPTRIE